MDELDARGKVMSTAESLTGGLVASKIVEVVGAGEVFHEGLITYHNSAKVRRLYVQASLIEEKTAVSEEVARAMVLGLLANKSVDYCVATTGYADSSTGCEGGQAFIACGSQDKKIVVKEYHFDGDRNYVRECVAGAAIFQLLTTFMCYN